MGWGVGADGMGNRMRGEWGIQRVVRWGRKWRWWDGGKEVGGLGRWNEEKEEWRRKNTVEGGGGRMMRKVEGKDDGLSIVVGDRTGSTV